MHLSVGGPQGKPCQARRTLRTSAVKVTTICDVEQACEASRRRREELARRFFAAAEEGDTEGLVGLLSADAVAYGDGGGRAVAFPHPVHGRERVVRLLLVLRRRVLSLGLTWRPAEINGQPGALFLDPPGEVPSSSSRSTSLIRSRRCVPSATPRSCNISGGSPMCLPGPGDRMRPRLRIRIEIRCSGRVTGRLIASSSLQRTGQGMGQRMKGARPWTMSGPA